MKKLFYSLLAIAMTAGVYSCHTNAVTGRKSLNIVDESTMRQMATNQYSSFIAENHPVNGTADAAMVKRVGQKISKAVNDYMTSIGKQDEIKGYNWEFNLVNENQANAWCMPGGKVVFYSGIMPICKDETGVAVVMGHEVAHAIARHGNERYSQQMAAQGIGLLASEYLKTKPDEAQQLFNTLYPLGSQVAVLLPYSRLQESEADEMGVIFMAMAGYDPNEAVKFWERMQAIGGSKPPEFLSTHPSNERRIQDLKGKIPKAMTYYKK